MRFDDFARVVKASLERYLHWVNKIHSAGHLRLNERSVLYPRILLVTNCSGFFVAELVGATTEFQGLIVKRHAINSIDFYFNQFDDPRLGSMFQLDGSGHGFEFLCLAQESDFDAVKRRFPSVELYSSLLIWGGVGNVFSFGDRFESCSIENCILVNRFENYYRCKNILTAYIFAESITESKLAAFFTQSFTESVA